MIHSQTCPKLVAVGMLMTALSSGLCFAGDHDREAHAALQTIKPAGSQLPQFGPQAYFTGRVRVDPLVQANEVLNASSAYVSFEPAARSAWHSHPKGQHLVVTSGLGLTQQWGQPVQQLRAGDVVWCPPGVKHWHGATPTSAMTHLAVTGVADGKSVTWMEKVSDEQYASR